MPRMGTGAILDAGAPANLVCFQWLRRHNELLASRGSPAVSTYPARATFKFGDGRPGEVCHAADIAAGVAGVKGMFTAFVLDSDTPALLSKGALETLQGRLDFAGHALTLGTDGKAILLQMIDAGHYFLSVADFSRLSSSASSFWAPKNRETQLMDLMRNGGFRRDDASQADPRSAPANFSRHVRRRLCEMQAMRRPRAPKKSL